MTLLHLGLQIHPHFLKVNVIAKCRNNGVENVYIYIYVLLQYTLFIIILSGGVLTVVLGVENSIFNIKFYNTYEIGIEKKYFY